MLSFDVIETASDGYQLAWKERGYLVKLAAVPFLIKLVCYGVVMLLGWEQDFTRQAMVMLPSYFADGWLLSHLTRLVLLDQRWPFRPTGNSDKDMQVMQDRALGIMRGTLMFAVIRFMMDGVNEILYLFSQAGMEPQGEEMTASMFIAGFVSFTLLIWAFRLVWLYIPAAVNYPVRRFMQELGGYGASWPLLGVWFICFIPLFFVHGLLISLFGMVTQQSSVSPEIILFAAFFGKLRDTAVGILATTGIALGLRQYYSPQKKRKSRRDN